MNLRALHAVQNTGLFSRWLVTACLLPFFLSGCMTPRILLASPDQLYDHPKMFVAEQAVCMSAYGQETCLMGELRRTGNTFSLSLVEPSMLTVLLAVESSEEHKVKVLTQVDNALKFPIDPTMVMDTIRALHAGEPPVMDRGKIVLRVPNQKPLDVKYDWGGVLMSACPYPVDLWLEFPRTASSPSVQLHVTNTNVTCETLAFETVR